jgi:hypothetical protein
MDKYQNLGINNRMVALSSLANRVQQVVGVDFDTQYEIQARTVRASRGGLSQDFMGFDTGNVIHSSFATGSSLSFQSVTRFNVPNQSKKIMGDPYIAFYQGSVDPYGTTGIAAEQIYPVIGANVTPGRYVVQCFYNAHVYGGVPIQVGGQITDTQGTSTQAFTLRADARYFNYLSQDQ